MTLDGKETPMNSTPAPKAPEGGDASGAAPADEGLAHAYKQIVRADEQLARLSEQVARMERDAARAPSAEPDPPSPPARPASRTLVSLPWAACIVVAALVLLSSYGGAKLVVARWPSQLASTQSLPPENPPLAAEPAPPAVQLAATAEAVLPQATPVAQNAPQDTAPAATAAVPDQTQLLQTMARNLANLERSIEQLNATQQQLAKTAGDNSKEIAELKASQEELKRALAKVSEQNLPKASSPATQPASALRKPERTVQPQRARARPWIPRQDWYYYDDW
jgi:hypothetical protein